MNDYINNNRRKGPDILVKTIRIISAISWLFILLLYIIVAYAKPQFETTFFNSLLKVPVKTSWDRRILPVIMIMLALLVIICFAGTIINLIRHKRKTDRFNKSIIFFGIGSLIGLIYLMLI